MHKYSWIPLLFALALGGYVRLLNYRNTPLWVDEAWRANILLAKGQILKFFTDNDLYSAITSPLYVFLNQLFTFFSVSENTLRLSSLVPSVFSILLAYKIVTKISDSWILAFGCALAFAMNLEMVRYAKELKPYSFEMFIYLGCIYLAICCFDNTPGLRRRLCTLLMALIFALFSAPNVTFLWPSLIASVFYFGVTERNKKIYIPAIFMGLFFAIQSFLLYHFVWIHAADDGLLAYWSDGFSKTGENQITFIAEKTGDIFLLSLRSFQSGYFSKAIFGKIFHILCMALIAGGLIGCLFKKKSEYILIFMGPFFSLLILNYFHRWPYGALRVNIFLLSLMLLICFLIGVWRNPLVSKGVGLIFIFWFGIFTFPIDRGAFANGPPVEDSRSVLRKLKLELESQSLCAQSQSVRVLMNPAISNSKDYYLNFDSKIKSELSDFYSKCVSFEKMPEAYSDSKGAKERILENLNENKTGSVWIIYSHLSVGEINSLIQASEEEGHVSKRTDFEGAGLFLVSR